MRRCRICRHKCGRCVTNVTWALDSLHMKKKSAGKSIGLFFPECSLALSYLVSPAPRAVSQVYSISSGCCWTLTVIFDVSLVYKLNAFTWRKKESLTLSQSPKVMKSVLIVPRLGGGLSLKIWRSSWRCHGLLGRCWMPGWTHRKTSLGFSFFQKFKRNLMKSKGQTTLQNEAICLHFDLANEATSAAAVRIPSVPHLLGRLQPGWRQATGERDVELLMPWELLSTHSHMSHIWGPHIIVSQSLDYMALVKLLQTTERSWGLGQCQAVLESKVS